MTTTSSAVPAGIEFEDKPEGPVSAAIIAVGIGALALGIFTTLSEASVGMHDFFEWSVKVGPLSGKTISAVIVWLASWAVLYYVLRDKPYETKRALTISLILLGLGLIGTFPTFFTEFKSE